MRWETQPAAKSLDSCRSVAVTANDEAWQNSDCMHYVLDLPTITDRWWTEGEQYDLRQSYREHERQARC